MEKEFECNGKCYTASEEELRKAVENVRENNDDAEMEELGYDKNDLADLVEFYEEEITEYFEGIGKFEDDSDDYYEQQEAARYYYERKYGV